jgi:hypothetical protein
MFRKAAKYLLLPILLLGSSAPVAAQQFVVDDAAIVDRGACQLEAWTGESSTWLLPACQFIPRTELTLGAGFVPENGGRSWEWVAQAKVSLREMQDNTAGVGLVFGVGMDPIGQAAGSRVSGAFAYLPVSLPLAGERVTLHGNLGWHYERDSDEHDHHHHGHNHDDGSHGHHGVTWGVRGDAVVAPRITVIAELFGEDAGRERVLAASAEAEQVPLPCGSERPRCSATWSSRSRTPAAGPDRRGDPPPAGRPAHPTTAPTCSRNCRAR